MIFIGLGSNLGHRERNLCRAVAMLVLAGFEVRLKSSIYETEPVGFTEQPMFLNAVIGGHIDCAPGNLLRICQKIETDLGRVRQFRWGPRTIDVDILAFDDLVVDVCLDSGRLILPHPQLPCRRFVLVPLAEIAPDVPVFQRRSAAQLLAVTSDTSEVKIWRDGEWPAVDQCGC